MTITALKDTKVFQPLKVGNIEVSHRVFFPPTTRNRSADGQVPSDLMLEYYDQRTKYPGTLIVTEATFISPEAGETMGHVPGIWNERQTKGWKKIVDKIHENKSFACMQFWFLGRGAQPDLLKQKGLDYVSSSAIYHSLESEEAAIRAGNPLRALTTEEVKTFIHEHYVNAAANAFKAGFDIIELHGAHGYFIDQFFQLSSNKRTDDYGGSIENRARLALEIIDTLSEKFGAERIAIRISPWAKFLGMKAEKDEIHPIATFGYFLSELQRRANEGREIAYVSIVEPRVQGNVSVAEEEQVGSNDFIYQIWRGKIVRAGNYTYDSPSFKTIVDDVNDDRTLVGFSRYYISNPDLIARLANGLELTKYDRSTFYNNDNKGYNTYSSYGETSNVDEESYRLPVALA